MPTLRNVISESGLLVSRVGWSADQGGEAQHEWGEFQSWNFSNMVRCYLCGFEGGFWTTNFWFYNYIDNLVVAIRKGTFYFVHWTQYVLYDYLVVSGWWVREAAVQLKVWLLHLQDILQDRWDPKLGLDEYYIISYAPTMWTGMTGITYLFVPFPLNEFRQLMLRQMLYNVQSRTCACHILQPNVTVTEN